MLLKQTRENKFPPNYEPEPYIVISQDTNDNNKMCSIAHLKEFVDPETVNRGQIDPQPHLPEQPVQPKQDHPAESQPYSTSSTY